MSAPAPVEPGSPQPGSPAAPDADEPGSPAAPDAEEPGAPAAPDADESRAPAAPAAHDSGPLAALHVRDIEADLGDIRQARKVLRANLKALKNIQRRRKKLMSKSSQLSRDDLLYLLARSVP
ncbi:unnamed protein product [Polarella glacialis]|uniref:Uncharacterized protein n=1 Tax=Polarella glacialis TaxID=89957 RepID=A0A813LI44_POLGL|nr:unnamed protein product [Polarella glacialis]